MSTANQHRHLQALIAKAQALGPARVAVAYPCSDSSFDAAIAAHRMRLIEPVLVGPKAQLTDIAARKGVDLARVTIVDSGDDPVEAARQSVKLCRDGQAQLIMKGSLHTDELLSAVIAKAGGLHTVSRISHAFVFDIPTYAKPLMLADCVVRIAPNLRAKRDITQNAIDLAHALGIAKPYVGILSAIETVNPAIPSTIDAAALREMAQTGQITGGTVEGPLAFDVAISAEAARIKGLESAVAGRPDILIVPNLEAGNMLYKQLIYLANAECAGIVLGMKVPVILTSRADSELSRIASCALAVIRADASRKV